MATITGKTKKSFIHAEGDGLVAPDGYKDVIGVTDEGDTIIGQARNDIIYAGDGENTITGGLGADEIHGGSSSDFIYVNENAEISGLEEIIDGGSGIDHLYLNTSAGVVDLTKSSISSIESLHVGISGGAPLNIEMTIAQIEHFSRIYYQGGSRHQIDIVESGVIEINGLNMENGFALNFSDGDDDISMTGSFEGPIITLGSGNDKLDYDPTHNYPKVPIVISGEDGNDVIYSSYGSNIINGDAGDDTLKGGSKADELLGGDGDDQLQGGGKADVLTGGDGADIFVYAKLKDSAPGHNNFDTVADFNQIEGDLLDLSKIDADTTVTGDQAFHFVGEEFQGNAGDLIAYHFEGNTIVASDVSGDGIADFYISLVGSLSLSSDDFIF